MSPIPGRQIQHLVDSPEIKFVFPSFVLLCRSSSETRVSILVGKKLGIAVLRNRIRRRLRECFRLAGDFPPGDYIVLGRSMTNTEPFARLLEQMKDARIKLGKMKG